MPYSVVAKIEVSYSCEDCGEEGYFETEGDEYIGGMFGLHGMNCPVCSQELENES